MPTQPDLIQRKLFTVHFHAYASPEYLKRFGTPRTTRTSTTIACWCSAARSRPTCSDRDWLIEAGRDGKGPRTPCSPSTTFSASCAPASAGSASRCCRIIWSRRTAGWCSCSARPTRSRSTRIFVYPEELKSVARMQVFRDFLVARRSAGISESAATIRWRRTFIRHSRSASRSCGARMAEVTRRESVRLSTWLSCDALRCSAGHPAYWSCCRRSAVVPPRSRAPPQMFPSGR